MLSTTRLYARLPVGLVATESEGLREPAIHLGFENMIEPAFFPLLDLPDVSLLLVWGFCTPKTRDALWRTSRLVRGHPGIAATVNFVAKCKDGRVMMGSPALMGGVVTLNRARLVMRLDTLPATSIERFFKHASSRHLQGTMRALLRDLSSRSFMHSVSQVTLQAWDLDDGQASATAQLLLQLFPSMRHLDLSTCVVGPPCMVAFSILHSLEAAFLRLRPSPNQASPNQARKLLVSLPAAGNVSAWQASCPSLTLEPVLTVPRALGSPPQWAVSPIRALVDGRSEVLAQ